MSNLFNMRATTSWSDPAYRPLNYREMAFKLWPTSPTPLTYLMSKLPSRTVDDPEYNIFEWRLPVQLFTPTIVSGNSADPEIFTITVATDNAYGVKVGDLLEIESTNYQYRVTTASTNGTTFAMTEWAGTNFTPVAGTHLLRWVGSTYAEGSQAPESVMRTPSMVTNYTQIFKDSVEITGTADATRTRPFKPWAQAKGEALERHMLKLEYATMRGLKKEDTTGSYPVRTFGGINSWISESKDFEVGGMSMDDLEDQLQIAFKYGSKDKGLVCGNTAVKIMNRVARNHAALQFNMTDKMNKDQTFGLDVTEWVTPFGILRIIPHALMSESDAYTQDGYILDFKYLEYVKLRGRDTKWNPNAQLNDQDSKRGYYQTECGFSLALPEVHQKWTNVAAFGADTPPV